MGESVAGVIARKKRPRRDRGRAMASQAKGSAAPAGPVVSGGIGRQALYVLLAFWTTTLEVAADAWRIELAPTQAEQGPLAAANLWGYRSAMVAAGSGALLVADQPGFGWTGAYLAIAFFAFLPFPLLALMRPAPGHGGGRAGALVTGLGASAIILGV